MGVRYITFGGNSQLTIPTLNGSISKIKFISGFKFKLFKYEMFFPTMFN
jgi:hypothetical protein